MIKDLEATSFLRSKIWGVRLSSGAKTGGCVFPQEQKLGGASFVEILRIKPQEQKLGGASFFRSENWGARLFFALARLWSYVPARTA